MNQRTESHDTLPAPARAAQWFCNKCGFLGDASAHNRFSVTGAGTAPCDYMAAQTSPDVYTAEQMHAFRAEGVAQQAAEVQRLRADAERYRWLRAQREWHEMNRTQDAMWTCDMPAAEVDAAIDSARAARQDGAGEQP